MNKLTLILILFLGITFISCKKDKDDLLDGQKIYFEYYYINHAWGLSYNHWIIDNQGNVRINKKQDSLVLIDPAKLNQYIEIFDTIIYKVDKQDFNYYISLIHSAANGKIIDSVLHSADYGGYEYNLYAPDGKSYKKVVLSSQDDNKRQKNLDSSAIKIDAWLKKVMIRKNK